MGRPASLAAWAIITISLLDIFVTVAVVNAGLAIEANPVLAWTFNHGPVAFAVFKTLTIIPGILALEACRVVNSSFANLAGRFAVYGYLAIYFAGTVRLHA